MPLYEMTGNSLTPIPGRTFTELGLQERANIQRAVRTHIAAITPGVKTMVLAEEFGEWDGANRRIDLLCLDNEARLVVVELKRDNGAHMELQALRYAAMISTMRFDQAVDAHRRYLKSIGSLEDPEKAIRKFLELEEEDQPGALSETVRIVLAASDFPQELTTAVLWLNKQGLDIRCVQMQPHLVDQRVLVDIQQVIPLPSAEQYQVAVREKSLEQAAAQASSTKDYTRYDLSIGDETFTNLPKRRLIYEIITEALRRKVTPDQIVTAVPWKKGTMFVSAPGNLDAQGFQAVFAGKSPDHYYTADQDLFRVDGRTCALTNQWGRRTLEAIRNILSILPDGAPIEYSPTTAVVEDVLYEDYAIRQRESGTIEVDRNGVPVQPVKPVLRDVATRLNVTQQNGSGKDMNTRQLGAQVIRAIKAL
jgi:hypothetical protein